MDRKPMVDAGIVTFNPDLSRLRENIEAILPQVRCVVVIDNHSDNIDALRELCRQYEHVRLFCSRKNRGIGAALNQIFRAAGELDGSEWVLTLDQDTVVSPGLISRYQSFMEDETIGSITALFRDRRHDYDRVKTNGDSEDIDYCITSANAVRISSWEEAGGFREDLFIDYVDYDFCFSLREKGIRIIRVNQILFLHEVGNSEIRVFLGKPRIVQNHTAFRQYYIIRNGIYLKRRHALANQYFTYRRMFHQVLKALLYEEEKLQKLSRSIAGLIDGIRFKI